VNDNGFVSLSSLRGGASSTPAQILEEIRTIYFQTTKQTIQHDLAHAIELLKALPDEETREKATVYMEGLAQMRRDWAGASRTVKGHGASRKVKGHGASRKVKRQRSKVKGKGKGTKS
jgi:hypothetical protein